MYYIMLMSEVKAYLYSFLFFPQFFSDNCVDISFNLFPLHFLEKKKRKSTNTYHNFFLTIE